MHLYHFVIRPGKGRETAAMQNDRTCACLAAAYPLVLLTTSTLPTDNARRSRAIQTN